MTTAALDVQERIIERRAEVEEVAGEILEEIERLEEAGAGTEFINSLRVSAEKEVAGVLEMDEDLVTSEMIFNQRSNRRVLRGERAHQEDELTRLQEELGRPARLVTYPRSPAQSWQDPAKEGRKPGRGEAIQASFV